MAAGPSQEYAVLCGVEATPGTAESADGADAMALISCDITPVGGPRDAQVITPNASFREAVSSAQQHMRVDLSYELNAHASAGVGPKVDRLWVAGGWVATVVGGTSVTYAPDPTPLVAPGLAPTYPPPDPNTRYALTVRKEYQPGGQSNFEEARGVRFGGPTIEGTANTLIFKQTGLGLWSDVDRNVTPTGSLTLPTTALIDKMDYAGTPLAIFGGSAGFVLRSFLFDPGMEAIVRPSLSAENGYELGVIQRVRPMRLELGLEDIDEGIWGKVAAWLAATSGDVELAYLTGALGFKLTVRNAVVRDLPPSRGYPLEKRVSLTAGWDGSSGDLEASILVN